MENKIGNNSFRLHAQTDRNVELTDTLVLLLIGDKSKYGPAQFLYPESYALQP